MFFGQVEDLFVSEQMPIDAALIQVKILRAAHYAALGMTARCGVLPIGRNAARDRSRSVGGHSRDGRVGIMVDDLAAK